MGAPLSLIAIMVGAPPSAPLPAAPPPRVVRDVVLRGCCFFYSWGWVVTSYLGMFLRGLAQGHLRFLTVCVLTLPTPQSPTQLLL